MRKSIQIVLTIFFGALVILGTIMWLKIDNISQSNSQNQKELSRNVQKKLDLSKKSKWYGKTIVTFGDSITWYDGHKYILATKEAGNKVKGYQSYMRKSLNVTVINQGISGNTTPQINRRIKTCNFSNVDAVTILAGTNDFRDMDIEKVGKIQPVGSKFDNRTFIGAYQEAIEYILRVNPEIKVYLFTPIKAWTDEHGLMPEAYPNAVIELGKLYSLNVCDLYHESGINDLTKNIYIVDSNTVPYDFHPSTKGYERVSNIIVPFLENH